MFCRYCGASIPDDSRFCPKCGRALVQSDPEPTAPTAGADVPIGPNAHGPNAPKAEPAPKWTPPKLPDLSKLAKAPGGRGKLPIPLIAALAVVLVLGFAMCGGRGDGPSAGRGPSPSSSRSTPKPTQTPAAESSALDGYLEDQTITYESGAIYEGETLGGVPWGQGKMTYAEGDNAHRLYYEGEWNNGEREGQGTMVWVHGAKYEGQWADGLQNGWGVYDTWTGNTFIGNFVDDKMDGDIIEIASTGKVFDCVYEKGDRISITEITDTKKGVAAIAGEFDVPPAATSAPKVPATPKPTSTPKPTAAPKPIPAPVSASSKDADGKVPDPSAFFQCARNEDKSATSFDSDGRVLSVKFDLDDGEDGVDEFIDLLQDDRYHLTLRETKSEDYTKTSASKFETYYFDYTGDKTVGIMHDGSRGPTAPVYVLVGYHYDEGRIGLALYYGDGLTLSDPGDRASTLPQDLVGSSSGSSGGSTGGSSSGSSSGGATKVTVKCPKCKGEKKITCTECDGKKYKISYVSAPNYSGKSTTMKEVRTDCFKCKGTGTIECPKCHGSGEG